jgi:O-antigen ligase
MKLIDKCSVFLAFFVAPLSFESYGFEGDSQVILKAGVWLLFGILLVIKVFGGELKIHLSSIKYYQVFLLVLLVSSLISGVAYGVVVVLVLLLFSIYLGEITVASVQSKNQLMWVVVAAFSSLTVINFLFLLSGFDGVSERDDGRFFGLVGQPSQASQLAAITLMLIVFCRLSLVLKFLMILVSCCILYYSGGRTVFLAMLISLILYKFISIHQMKAVSIGLIFFGVSLPFIMVISLYLLESNIDAMFFLSRSGDERELYTLSGRVPLWEAIILALPDNIFFGIGFGGSRDELPMLYQSEGGWFTDSAHNAYLHILFEAGVVGLIFLIGVLFYVIRTTVDKSIMALLIFLLIVGCMSSSFLGPGVSILTLLFIVLGLFGQSRNSLYRSAA